MADGSRDNPKQKLKQLLHSQSRRARAEATSGQAGPTPSPAGAWPTPSHFSKVVKNRALREKKNHLCFIRFGFQHKDPTPNSTLILKESLYSHSLPTSHQMTLPKPPGISQGWGPVTTDYISSKASVS